MRSDLDPGLPAFELIEYTPAADAVFEDRNAELSLRFSSPVDSDTLNVTSFRVRHGDFAVDGTRAANGDRVVFRPRQDWLIAERYEVELAAEIHDLAKRSLKPVKWSFTVRSGRWSVQQISTTPRSTAYQARLSVSSRGRAAVMWDSHDSDTSKVTNLILRHATGTEWRMVRVGMDHGATVATNNNGWIAFADEHKGGIANEADRLFAGLRMMPAFEMELSDDSKLYTLFFDKNLRLNYYHDYNEDVLTNDYVMSPATNVTEAGFALLGYYANSWMAIWTEPNAQDASARSVWVTDHPACDPEEPCPRMLSQPENNAGTPVIASDVSVRSVVAAWRETDGAWSRVRVARQGLNDARWSDPVTLSEPIGSASWPHVGVDSEGRVLVVWLQAVGSATRVYSARFDPKTNQWSAQPDNLSGDVGTVSTNLALSVAPSGSALALWTEQTTTTVVRWAHYRPGNGWTTESDPLSQKGKVDRGAGCLSVAMTEDGRAFATWGDEGQIWAGRYD